MEIIQNCWKEFKEKYNDVQFEVTLKLDGTSETFYYKDGEVGFWHKYSDQEPDSRKLTFFKIEKELQLFKRLKSLGRNIAIKGKIIGEGIHGNKENIIGQRLYIFDIYDIDQQRYLTPSEKYKILSLFNLRQNHVPYLGSFTLDKFKTIEDILKFAEGKSINAEIREGLVFKSETLINGQVLSFKVINNQFLNDK